MALCDECAFFEYDEDDEQYVCSADMDEDDYFRMISQNTKDCPFFRNGNEYAVVKHQI